jgi:glutamate N-acetyltransferase / amino-acid N-acetyltransferase
VTGPRGYRIHVGTAGIKDDTRDLLIVETTPAAVAGVFTRSRFAGPSIGLSRATVAGGRSRGLVVVSKNANVANGPVGVADAEELQALAAGVIGADAGSVVVASTGVIGRRYPMERVRAYFSPLRWPAVADGGFDDAAEAIMTTDTHPKIATATVGGSTVVGIAKGVGMIEPDMATLLTFFFTDAVIDPAALDAMLRRVVATTFNALSIDTDTSTSDSAVIWANGLAGPVDLDAFEAAFGGVALALVKMIAADGEGASKLIEVRVTGARDTASAKLVAKAIVNSPLVKTAVHGADPNWGRLAMAVGKCSDETDIDPDGVVLSIGGIELYPSPADEATLARAAEHMAGDEVVLGAELGVGDGAFTAWGCDLTEGYIRINADYTT